MNSFTLTKCVRKVKAKIRQRRYSRTPFTQTMVIRITNYLEWLGRSGKNCTKLTCLEITGYRIKYSTVLWLLELQIRHSHKVQTQVHTVNSNSRSSNCQCSLFSKKNPIFQVFCISRRLAIPINLDKWGSTVVGTLIPCVTHL